jgi:hypothetical protein
MAAQRAALLTTTNTHGNGRSLTKHMKESHRGSWREEKRWRNGDRGDVNATNLGGLRDGPWRPQK